MNSPARTARTDKSVLKLLTTTLFVVVSFMFYSSVQSYLDRQGAVDNQREGCARSVLDRIVNRDRAVASFRANLIVADDPKQPKLTRDARRVQATVDLRAARSFDERVPEKEQLDNLLDSPGGVVTPTAKALDCRSAYPNASWLP